MWLEGSSPQRGVIPHYVDLPGGEILREPCLQQHGHFLVEVFHQVDLTIIVPELAGDHVAGGIVAP